MDLEGSNEVNEDGGGAGKSIPDDPGIPEAGGGL